MLTPVVTEYKRQGGQRLSPLAQACLDHRVAEALRVEHLEQITLHPDNRKAVQHA